MKFQKPAFLCIVDLKKAFDTVKFPDIIHYSKRGIFKDLIPVIDELNTNAKTYIWARKELSEAISLIKCTSQGALNPIQYQYGQIIGATKKYKH